MNVIEWLAEKFGLTGPSGEIMLTDKAVSSEETQLLIRSFAIESVVNIISATIARCEVRTFVKGKEVRGDEYYLWNYKPNVNQNSTQFKMKLIRKLLIDNEALVLDISGQLVVADNYSEPVKYALKEWVFEHVTVENLTFDRSFKMSEVMYFKLNEENIKNLLDGVLDSYNQLIAMSIKKYKRAGGRKGKVTVDSTRRGDEKAQEKLSDLFNRQFRRYFEDENAVIQLSNGTDYTEIPGDGSRKSTSDVVDLISLTKEAFAQAARAYRVPPALISGEIADVQKITDNLLTFCINPIVDLLENEICSKRYEKGVLKGSFLFIDTTCIRHIDIFDIAEKIDKLIANGMYCIDEIREKIGDAALNTKWSRRHFITKNYDAIDTVEGGERDNDNEGSNARAPNDHVESGTGS